MLVTYILELYIIFNIKKIKRYHAMVVICGFIIHFYPIYNYASWQSLLIHIIYIIYLIYLIKELYIFANSNTK